MKENLSFITYKKHKKLLQTILNESLYMYKVNGLMIIGSIARGDAYPESDLDLYVLLENGQKKDFIQK